MSGELLTLKARWRRINESEMPDDIASQPIELVRKAVEWSRRGIVPVIPKQALAVVGETSPDESLQPWDFHKEH
jgi:hypothetical protein